GKPFRVGDYVAIAGVEGVVNQIGLFNTTLGHTDRSRVIVPNRKIVGEILHNYGTLRQLDLQISAAYDSNITGVVALIREVLAANPRVLADPEPVVGPVMFGDSAVAIGIKPWVAVPDQVAATGEIHAAVLEAFRARGIVVPYPQREIRML